MSPFAYTNILFYNQNTQRMKNELHKNEQNFDYLVPTSSMYGWIQKNNIFLSSIIIVYIQL